MKHIQLEPCSVPELFKKTFRIYLKYIFGHKHGEKKRRWKKNCQTIYRFARHTILSNPIRQSFDSSMMFLNSLSLFDSRFKSKTRLACKTIFVIKILFLKRLDTSLYHHSNQRVFLAKKTFTITMCFPIVITQI